MPRIKRWFPVSQDFNDDGSLWDFTEKFGDRSLRLWLEICAILDKTENRWEMTESSCKAVFRKARIRLATGWLAVGWLLRSRWLAVPQRLQTGQVGVYGSPNYWKYHPRAEPEDFLFDTLLPSFLPSDSSLKKEKNPEPAPLNATPEPTADSKNRKLELSPELRVAADAVYKTDVKKYARLPVWLQEGKKHGFSDAVMAEALRRFLPYAAECRDWYPYLDKIVYKADQDLNRDKHAAEHAKRKEELRKVSEAFNA